MNVSAAIAILPGFPSAAPSGNQDDTAHSPRPGPPAAGDARRGAFGSGEHPSAQRRRARSPAAATGLRHHAGDQCHPWPGRLGVPLQPTDGSGWKVRRLHEAHAGGPSRSRCAIRTSRGCAACGQHRCPPGLPISASTPSWHPFQAGALPGSRPSFSAGPGTGPRPGADPMARLPKSEVTCWRPRHGHGGARFRR
jgi:hypothetical protein